MFLGLIQDTQLSKLAKVACDIIIREPPQLSMLKSQSLTQLRLASKGREE
jgi:hypothetical protein